MMYASGVVMSMMMTGRPAGDELLPLRIMTTGMLRERKPDELLPSRDDDDDVS